MNKQTEYAYCEKCHKNVTYFFDTKKYVKNYRGENCEFDITIARCDECGEEVSPKGLIDRNIEEVDLQYRKMKNLVSVQDIQNLMELYNIGKTPLSNLLGFGEITITRYLDGQIPSRRYSDIIYNSIIDVDYMLKNLELNKYKLERIAYEKVLIAANNLKELFYSNISKKMLISISYLFNILGEITPMQLQKLLYFSQGIYYEMFNKPLYEDDCEAWTMGPVYEPVYQLFKNFTYNPIDDSRFLIFKYSYKELGDNEKNILNLVGNTFGIYSGKILSKLSHNCTPWKIMRMGYGPNERSNLIIKKDEIYNYFHEIAKKYKLNDEKDLLRYINENIEKEV